jgi:nitroreductase
MDVPEAVRTVLAVRTYDGRPIPDDVLRRIVDSAHMTASSMNRQPWHFVLLTDPDTLRAVAKTLRTGPYVANAAAAVAVAVEGSSPTAISDASRAIQSMILTAWDAGVGSNWVGFGGLDGVRSILQIPDSYDVLAVVPLGYPAEERTSGRKNRRPLGEVASAGKFGRPLE